MRRIALCVGIATIAFVLGVTTNIGVDRFGEFAINALWEVEQLTELQPATSFANVTSGSAGKYFCGYLVVSVPRDGTLYLNREEAGTIVNTAALTGRLRTIFALREEFGAYAQPINLFSRVPEDLRIDTTVYIKAHRSMAHGKVADLVRSIKDAGADPVYLLDPVHLPADRSSQSQ